ncbi:MAG: septal ring lytic transglycosylase RlpA family protein [Balneolaceae bacterium]
MNRSASISALLLLLILLQACGVSRRGVQPGTAATAADAGMMLQSGVASWYGPNFHGKQTANGEVFNMHDLTAAHRTLPFNTVVLVESLDSGKSVVVRINDRGPFVGDRVIDLSRRAAEEIEMIGSGVAPVEIFLIEEGDRPVTDQNRSGQETFTVQVASFDTERDANRRAADIDGARVEAVPFGGRTVYRVYVGVYSDADRARQSLRRLQRQGISGFVKQIEN